MTHSYVWHGFFISDVTHSYVWHEFFIHDVTHSYVWHRSSYVTWLIRDLYHVCICMMTHSYATWLIHMYEHTHMRIYVGKYINIYTYTCIYPDTGIYTDTCILGVAMTSRLLKITGLFCKTAYKRDYILQKRPVILRSLLVVATPYHTWFIHLCDVTHSCVCRDVFMCAMEHPHVWTHMNICIYMCIYIHTHICTCIHTSTFVVYTIHVLVYMHMYICVYIQRIHT